MNIERRAKFRRLALEGRWASPLHDELERWPLQECCREHENIPDALPPANGCPRCAVHRSWILALEWKSTEQAVLGPIVTSIRQQQRREGYRDPQTWAGVLAHAVEQSAPDRMTLRPAIKWLTAQRSVSTEWGLVGEVREDEHGDIHFVDRRGKPQQVGRPQLTDALRSRRDRDKRTAEARKRRRG